jgi:hypothetical protein
MTIHKSYFDHSLTELANANNPAASQLKPGDVVFYHRRTGKSWENNPYHCLIAKTTQVMIHSYPASRGVDTKSLPFFTHDAVVFRHHGDFPSVGQNAANKADEMLHGNVGYSSGLWGRGRMFNILLHNSRYAQGAISRLEKYVEEDRDPKNVTCAEMCVLCYQLTRNRNHPAFPKLDAKHTRPQTLEEYLLKSNGWDLVGKVVGKAQ